MAEPWMGWAVAEGGTKTVSRILQKFVGKVSGAVPGVLLATLVIGFVQMIGGFFGSPLVHRKSVRARAGQIAGSALFGVFATLATVLGVLSFTYPGADVGITTFIVTMSIIPGALIDRYCFGRSLEVRQLVGIAVFLGAGWAMLDFPNLVLLIALPPWVWLTAAIAVSNAISEGITQVLANVKIDPLVNNFWVGLTTVVLAAALLGTSGSWGAAGNLPPRFWVGSAVIGGIVVAMISFKLMAYRGGGSIALKKLIMQSTYLISATVLGWIVYAEPFTAGKVIGIIGYVVAFVLMDKGTWAYVSSQFLKPVAASR